MGRLTIPIKLRWSDIDAYQHVNNARMFTLLEETRIAAFWTSAPQAEDGDGVADRDRAGDRDSDGGPAGDREPVPATKVLATGPGTGTNTYIARQEIEYLLPVPYSLKPLPVELWISHLGGASIDVCYEIDLDGEPAVRAMTTIVLVDEATGRPRRLTDEERAAWAPYVDEPVRFRRRRDDTG